MSITRYRYFEKVARAGSIREAAEALHVAPSAISRQIAQLEYEFDIALFERYSRGMTLTVAGEILYAHAREILNHYESANSEILNLKGLRRGRVRVWSVEGMIKDFVVPIISGFHARYPGIFVDLEIASTDLITNALLADEADVGIVFNPDSMKGLTVVASVDDPLHAVVAPGHPLARARELSLADLINWPIAIAGGTFGMRHILDRAMEALELDLAPALETNSIEALRSYARSGTGAAVITSLAVKQDLDLGQLVAVPLRLPDAYVTSLKICTRRNRTLAVAAQELANVLAESFGNMRRNLPE